MKNKVLVALLVFSFLTNGLLFYYIKEISKPDSSIMKLSYADNTVVYCERSEDVKSCNVNMDENIFIIGDATLSYNDNLYLTTPENEINLSVYDALGFVINSKGELLYGLVTPTLKKQKVFVTPKGLKYHTDAYCAGMTGFEVDYDLALKLEREPCKICAG